jgi:transcriptional regulator with XRE-family HTH domain
VAAPKSDFFYQMGRRIAALRNARGWSQEALSERAEIGTSYIAHIEIGSRRATVTKLMQIATALDVPLWRLITDERLTADESARDAAERELARTAHGLDAADLRALAYFATRLQSAGRTTGPTAPHKKLRGR